jgi:hypothetical protein
MNWETIVNGEYLRKWKNVVIVGLCFNARSQLSSGGSDESHENLN